MIDLERKQRKRKKEKRKKKAKEKERERKEGEDRLVPDEMYELIFSRYSRTRWEGVSGAFSGSLVEFPGSFGSFSYFFRQ